MAESLAIVDKEPSVEAEGRKASQMPKPKGYKILIALPEPDEKTEGGIINPPRQFITKKWGPL